MSSTTVAAGGSHQAIYGSLGALHPIAHRAGKLVFTAGISGREPGAPADRQIAGAFDALSDTLKAAGTAPAAVGQLFVWLADLAHLPLVERCWQSMFPDPASRPARHVIKADFERGKLIEVEAIAVLAGARRSINEIAGVGKYRADAGVPLAAQIDDLLFTSALEGVDADGVLSADAEVQIDRMFDNAAALLAACGYHCNDAAHMFVWQRDHALRQRINDPWAATFPDKFRRPARHALMIDSGEVAAQINLIAVRSEDRETLPELPGLAHTGQREPGFLPLSARRGNLLFTAATFGADKQTGKFIADIQEQIRSALDHTQEIVAAQGYSMQDVAHAYIWHKSDDYRGLFDPLWEKLYPDPARRPVRHDVRSPLPDVLQLQIELIAVR